MLSISVMFPQGDSGGPFVCRDMTDTWTVFGVTSHGIEECVRATVYKSVPYFRGWIDQQMQLLP